jgi:hypothetical protein
MTQINTQPDVILFPVPGRNIGDGLLLIYLQILASLTVNISRVYGVSNGGALHSNHEVSGDDSDSEMDHEDSNVEELQVSSGALRHAGYQMFS